MIQTIRNAWKIPELKRKILFTVFALLIFRLGSVVPVPFINTELLQRTISAKSGTIFGLLNTMSGSAFSQATVFALSIQPYINSSIIIQLLTIAIPALERLQKEGGEEGRKKIEAISRYTAVGIALLQGFGYYTLINSYGLITQSGIWPAVVIIMSFTAGATFLMWLGEQITEFGIGNGISIILFAGIISRVPTMISTMITGVTNYIQGTVLTSDQIAAGYTLVKFHPAMIPLFWLGMFLLVVFVVFITNSEAPHSGSVRPARGGPQDVRRPVHPHPHEGEYVGRSAHHLRPGHRLPAGHHRDVRSLLPDRGNGLV